MKYSVRLRLNWEKPLSFSVAMHRLVAPKSATHPQESGERSTSYSKKARSTTRFTCSAVVQTGRAAIFVSIRISLRAVSQRPQVCALGKRRRKSEAYSENQAKQLTTKSFIPWVLRRKRQPQTLRT